ncbi:hypothetical protein CDAR_589591 [Caerostris darwini]|uniref:Uncharacterized protein n=1 Tax=Caerostris darwini TaxID=1538125 RepID=A0AAV4RDJ9_9ARAC|nr:hypothetical protein CDAR_589591 [Caerostris darwini]
MDGVHTPAIDRHLLVDRLYDVLFFPTGLERIEASDDLKQYHTGHMLTRTDSGLVALPLSFVATFSRRFSNHYLSSASCIFCFTSDFFLLCRALSSFLLLASSGRSLKQALTKYQRINTFGFECTLFMHEYHSRMQHVSCDCSSIVSIGAIHHIGPNETPEFGLE